TPQRIPHFVLERAPAGFNYDFLKSLQISVEVAAESGCQFDRRGAVSEVVVASQHSGLAGLASNEIERQKLVLGVRDHH
ncbi:hypothetical protein, partial [Pseudomonas sp.]|uniref:hypothetical protein n=1 Tax=Pseudomonas sp. TaxID=306 RepID=UPI00262F0AFC